MNPSSGLIQDSDEASLSTLVGLGLRATLSSESLITGQLYIELDFHPGQPAVYRAVVSDGLAEIPSIPSGIQEVMANAQRFVSDLQNNLDIPKLAQDISKIVAGMDSLINSDETQEFTAEASQTLLALQTTLDNLNKMIANVEGEVEPIGTSIVEVLARAEAVLELAEVQLSDDSDIAYRIGTTLKEVEAAARAVRLLADQLEQQPESLIKGKR
jgi:paraquat-inducible protein B